jgi:phosphoglucosamine mutase
MRRYFGTDGVRGIANVELTCELAFALGRIAVHRLGPLLVIGRDTRRSGQMLEAALVAGITAEGGDALLAGIIPTPAVALLVGQTKASGGIVISASHNPPEYNGIKFFDHQGFKLAGDVERAMDQELAETLQRTRARVAATNRLSLATGRGIGQVHGIEQASQRYIDYAVGTIKGRVDDLGGLVVAVDCGHGAAAETTPEALRALNATVHTMNCDHDGDAINVGCGSTDLAPLSEFVRQTGADIGIAHDGDADRVLAVDSEGHAVSGDVIEAICAKDLLERDALPHHAVVSTEMANLGFMLAMQELGIRVIRTPVGDSNILAAMREGGYALGGEQSGHTIFLDHATTGDGLICALQLLAVMKGAGKSLSELSRVMRNYPQVLINVASNASTEALFSNEELMAQQHMTERELSLQGGGRVLVRASGTEPCIRIMVEAADEKTANNHALSLAATVDRLFGSTDTGRRHA